MARFDFGRLTQEETKELLRGCIDNLSLEDVINALMVYSADEREEIIASLEAHR